MAALAGAEAGETPNMTSNMEDEDDALAGLYAASMESAPGADDRERSASLWADPKMRELKHYFRSHKHEQKLRQRAGLEGRSGSTSMLPEAGETKAGRRESAESVEPGADQEMYSLRTDGCDLVNVKLKRLAESKAVLPWPQRHHGLPKVSPSHIPRRASMEEQNAANLRKEQMRRLEALSYLEPRLQWRHKMDDSLHRLLIDMELSEDDRLKEYSHKARCGHLDKIYDWYLTHGMKEARKERAAPPYVRYNASGPVMPGSMRPPPKTNEPPAASVSATRRSSRGDANVGMSGSQSLPNLAASATAPQAKAEGQGQGGSRVGTAEGGPKKENTFSRIL